MTRRPNQPNQPAVAPDADDEALPDDWFTALARDAQPPADGLLAALLGTTTSTDPTSTTTDDNQKGTTT